MKKRRTRNLQKFILSGLIILSMILGSIFLFLSFDSKINFQNAKALNFCLDPAKANYFNGECLSNQELVDRQNGYLGNFLIPGSRNCWSVGRYADYGCLASGQLKLPCDNLSRYNSFDVNFDPGKIECSETRSIYGLHDIGGENYILNEGLKGWTLAYEDIGSDPNDNRSKDYTSLTSKGIKIISRLDAQTYSTNPSLVPTNGVFPCSNRYPDFVKRVINFVKNSKGSNIWIIGNEMNLIESWPTCNGLKESITPQASVNLFKEIRSQIKALPGRSEDQVILGAVSPWPNDLDNSKTGVDYQSEMFNMLNSGDVDGLALHTYTYPGAGQDINKISSNEIFSTGGIYKHYRVYQSLLNTLPTWAKSLPAYITESAPLDGFEDKNNSWIKTSYQEIVNWNSNPLNQKICAVTTYRFKNYDKWGLENKPNLLQDYLQALKIQNSQSCIKTSSLPEILLSRDKILFTPDKSNRKQFKVQDLNLNVLDDSLFSQNTSGVCEFKVKVYGKDNNNNITGFGLSQTLFKVNSILSEGSYSNISDSFEVPYSIGKGCGVKFPLGSQSTAKWQFQIKIKRSDGQSFKAFTSYSFLYGAIVLVDISSEIL